jgi:hypothetical protein
MELTTLCTWLVLKFVMHEKIYRVKQFKNITSRNIHSSNSVLRSRIRIRISLHHFRKLDPDLKLDSDTELDPDQELDPQHNEKLDPYPH